MLTKDLQTRTNEFVLTMNRHDLDAYTGFYGKEATVYDPMYHTPLKGHDAIRKDFEDFMIAFPDMKFTLKTQLVSGDTVALEIVASGTHRGILPGPSGPIRATNRAIEIRIAGFERIDDQGLIVEERRYYDVAGLLQQLGLMAA